ncbi:helix-turn-helix domain-containing protein [Actinotalea sp. M2MS4P-6]|uniref:helix-turn-helix domain-containing protein n=1 Tax=Actinotalea sp. M2MS4P-6 TaxID=2983762 RepID=UPI0021E35DCD|nr:helix-turn-helix domain-containing protein [Actinotalea sp. M2MS4P-6]MCV2394351.1 helix-turn-helix domain-containing protein [Actinotalea sp. M2MS4P-6]
MATEQSGSASARVAGPVIAIPESGAGEQESSDLLTLGRRIRHYRTERGWTLDRLGGEVGASASQLSLVENGRREPRVTLLRSIAAALGVPAAALLAPEPPSHRAALEIALDRAQRTGAYRALGLPEVRPGQSLPTEALEALVGLHTELARRADAAIATPEEARRASTALHAWMRERDNYLPAIEEVAEDAVRSSGYTTGPLTHRSVAEIAKSLGFSIIHTPDLPSSTRTVTDLANGRIYLPPASIPGGHGLRSLALQAIAHRLLGHERPRSYSDFMRQRTEITYFAAACLMPRSAAVGFLERAKRAKDLAVEDFRDAFGVTHETAAQRMTNLLTSHLDLRVHFMRVGVDGALYKGYENDGFPFPVDSTGASVGQTVCRRWPARAAFGRRDRTSEYHQYVDTPAGTYWASTQTGMANQGEFSIAFGVPFESATWFRGRETTVRTRSTCPDPACCSLPPRDLADRWAERSWPSAAVHTQILAPLPSGSFPGVDESEVFAFLERHSS